MNFQFPTIDFRKNTRSAVLFPGVRKQGFRGPPGKTPVFSEALQINRCALWPGRPWTTSPSPWTAGTAASGCTLTAHRLGRVAHRRPAPGGTPPGTPRRSARPSFLKKNSLEQPNSPPAFGLRAALAPPLRPSACALRLPLPAGRQAAGARGREATGGAALGGRGGVAPPVRERPRRGA